MNLNKKGFAITGILYTILILFLLLLSSLLAILATRINRLSDLHDNITSIIKYGNEILLTEVIDSIQNNYYITKYRGKYEIEINDNKTCYAYLPNNTLLTIQDNKIKYKNYPNDSQCMINTENLTDLTELNMINCDNNGINNLSFTKIYTPQHKEDEEDKKNINTLEKLGLNDILNSNPPSDLSTSATTDEGIYAIEDDLGTSYYFRGASERNYVKFGKYQDDLVYGSKYQWVYGEYRFVEEYFNSLEDCHYYYGEENCEQIYAKGDDMYWRIIRINGDGTIRMIYDGHKVFENGESNTYRHILTTDNDGVIIANIGFPTYPANQYIVSMGYMYLYTYRDSNGNLIENTWQHKNEGDSVLKQEIDKWYENNIIAEGLEEYVADAIYCNDRRQQRESVGNPTYVFDRLNSYTPSLYCGNERDSFTVSDDFAEGKGNGDLTYPIGAITVDEVMFAGIGHGNNKFYLYTGDFYFTMSPAGVFYQSGDCLVRPVSRWYFVTNDGRLYYLRSNDSCQGSSGKIKPVLSLRSDLTFTGTGTKTDPFEIKIMDEC